MINKFIFSNLFFALFAFPAYSAENDCPALEMNPILIKSIHDAQASLCPILNVGAEEDIRKSENTSPTGVSRRYRLKRISDKKYVAEIPVHFYGKTENGKLFSDVMRLRTQDCISEINKYLKGPDGDTLELKIQEISGSISKEQQFKLRDKKSNQIAPNFIEVTDITRPNSENYDKALYCSTITHEIFHLLGLPDTYKETLIGIDIDPETKDLTWYDNINDDNKVAYNCRALGPADSLMTNQNEAFNSVKALPEYEFANCECDPKDEEICKKSFSNANMDSSQCAAGYKSKKASFLIGTTGLKTDKLNQMGVKKPMMGDGGYVPDYSNKGIYGNGAGGMGSYDKNTDGKGLYGNGYNVYNGKLTFIPQYMAPSKIKRIYPPKRDSLLYPAEFRAITQPKCYTKNWLYYACSQNAYRTSKDRLGKGCYEMPPECKNPERWMK